MHAAKVSLAEAKQLVAYLEQEQFAEADALVDAFSMQQSAEIFTEVGKLTRQLHDSLNTFQLDERITGLVNEDIPDAESRLMYVIEETEKAANTTMDAVEKSMPINEAIGNRIDVILPEWQKLMSREIEIGEPETLTEADPQKEKVKAEGPVIDAEQRDDVVNGQDDVDDLLSSLGF